MNPLFNFPSPLFFLSQPARCFLSPRLVSRPRNERGFLVGSQYRPVFLSQGRGEALPGMCPRRRVAGAAAETRDHGPALRRLVWRPNAQRCDWPTPAAFHKEFHFNPAGLTPAVQGKPSCWPGSARWLGYQRDCAWAERLGSGRSRGA